GYNTATYTYFYDTADAIQNIIGYLLIASFFVYMFRRSVFGPYVRPTLAIFFLLIVVVSGAVFVRSAEHFYEYSRFVVEFQQNMFFVGVLLTFLLWIAMSYLHAESRQFVLLVSGLGIYFSTHAANYALQYLVPSLATVLAKVPPLAYTFMVALWFYTFWRVPVGEPAVEPAARGELKESLVKVQLSA
ncbi:MAG: hypothetical protein V3R29_06105, partial [Candidatus Acidoferrales bacterium]